jgi:hypothetical protein
VPVRGTPDCAGSRSAPARPPTSADRGATSPVTSLRAYGPQRLARTYRQRNRVEQAIEALLNGNDLDHLVPYRLRPNRVAIGFRLLARNLAIGLQIRDAGGRPDVIREPAAFRATQVEGLGTFTCHRRTVRVTRATAARRAEGQPARRPQRLRLPWTRLAVQLASSA